MLHLKLLQVLCDFDNVQILGWANVHSLEGGFAAHFGREKERVRDVSWSRSSDQGGGSSPHSQERGQQRMLGGVWQGSGGGLGQGG